MASTKIGEKYGETPHSDDEPGSPLRAFSGCLWGLGVVLLAVVFVGSWSKPSAEKPKVLRAQNPPPPRVKTQPSPAALAPPPVYNPALAQIGASAALYGLQRAHIVYVTDYGYKYHRWGCSWLYASRYWIDRDDARSRGYLPCQVCNPR